MRDSGVPRRSPRLTTFRQGGNCGRRASDGSGSTSEDPDTPGVPGRRSTDRKGSGVRGKEVGSGLRTCNPGCSFPDRIPTCHNYIVPLRAIQQLPHSGTQRSDFPSDMSPQLRQRPVTEMKHSPRSQARPSDVCFSREEELISSTESPQTSSTAARTWFIVTVAFLPGSFRRTSSTNVSFPKTLPSAVFLPRNSGRCPSSADPFANVDPPPDPPSF